MGRNYQYENIVGPDVGPDALVGISAGPRRFLPGGLTLFMSNASTGGAGYSYAILLRTLPLSPFIVGSGIFSTYADPVSGLLIFTGVTLRAFQLPACAEVWIQRSGGGAGLLSWAIGGIAYSPYP